LSFCQPPVSGSWLISAWSPPWPAPSAPPCCRSGRCPRKNSISRRRQPANRRPQCRRL